MEINKNIRCVRIKDNLLEMYPNTDTYKKMCGKLGYIVKDRGYYARVIVPVLKNKYPYKIHKNYLEFVPCDDDFISEIVGDAL